MTIDISRMFDLYKKQNDVYIDLMKRIEQQAADIQHLREETQKLRAELMSDSE